MPKRKAEFTDEITSDLIQEVKKRPCLWDPENSDHNDRAQMNAAWEEISNSLGIQGETLRLKWKNLRDCFKKLVKKRNVKSFEDYRCGWRYFQTLWFLYRPNCTEKVINDDTNSCEVNEDPKQGHIIKCEQQNKNIQVFVEEHNPISNTSGRSSCDTSAEEDYDLMFLKSLTPYLKQLQPIRKLVVRSKIQEILLNELAAQNKKAKSF